MVHRVAGSLGEAETHQAAGAAGTVSTGPVMASALILVC